MVYLWSQTAASNSSVDPVINWAEGAPSAINDSSRAEMSRVAKWRDDITGVNVTTGSGTAYALASSQVITANTNNFTVQFTPGTTNTGAVTLSVDSQTPKPLRFLTGIDLPGGLLISGSLYQATYRAATGEWLLHSFNASVYSIPIGAIIDFTGATSPNSNFILPQGQAISRTTYATYFAMVGTLYGPGDGSTTFNVVDLGGRTVYGKEATATRLTTGTVGIDGGTLGATGGGTQTLVTANLPAYTPAGSVANGAITVTNADASLLSVRASSTGLATGSGASVSAQSYNASQAGSSFSGTAQGGTSTPIKMAASGIILNKLLRVL